MRRRSRPAYCGGLTCAAGISLHAVQRCPGPNQPNPPIWTGAVLTQCRENRVHPAHKDYDLIVTKLPRIGTTKAIGLPIRAAPLYEDLMSLQGLCVVGSRPLFPKRARPRPSPPAPQPQERSGLFLWTIMAFWWVRQRVTHEYRRLLQMGHGVRNGLTQTHSATPIAGAPSYELPRQCAGVALDCAGNTRQPAAKRAHGPREPNPGSSPPQLCRRHRRRLDLQRQFRGAGGPRRSRAT
jgi:hypothetical protein